jgi:hypothetical protein
LAGAAVTAAKLADDAVANANLANAAVNTSELANNAVTRAKIAAGAVRASHVDSTQVQLRVAGSCLAGTRMQGFDASGAPICANASFVLPSEAATWPQLALRSDTRPVVAFYDIQNKQLKLAICGDESCATAVVRVLATLTVDYFFDGELTLLMRADDTAIVIFTLHSFTQLDQLYAMSCEDPNCRSWLSNLVREDDFVGNNIAAALRPGDLPILVHESGVGTNSVLDCMDSGCATVAENPIVGSSSVSRSTALAVSSTGLPLVLFPTFNGTDRVVTAVVCLDNGCVNSVNHDLLVDTGNAYAARIAAVFGSDGVATASYAANLSSAQPIYVMRCSGGLSVCGSASATQIATGAVGTSTDIVLGADGNPRVLYQGISTLALRVCADAGCTSSTLRTPDAVAGRGQNARIALRADGRPVLAYEDFGRVRVTVCAKVDCAP